MKVKLYVEGGGDHNKALDVLCRKGFRKFLENAKFLEGRMPAVVRCGGRKQAYDDFCSAVARQDAFSILLVDSEEPVRSEDSPWDHVYRRKGDQWKHPAGASDEQLHFMVEAMEAWFYADHGALADFYGKDFREAALSRRPDPETIPKKELFDGLSQASKDCQKGEYSKGSHSFEILALIDPGKVRNSCPYAARLLGALDKYC